METTLTFLGQACVLICRGEVRLLCDPWFSGRAHLSGWIPFPDPTPDERARLASLAETATHIYLSHAHEDHFDPVFLRRLTRKTLIVGAFRNHRFLGALRALTPTHQLVVLHPGITWSPEAGFTLRIHTEQPAFRTNSILEVRTPEGRVINANDCGLDTALLQAIAERGPVSAFLYTLNFLANGYPFPYLRARDADLEDRLQKTRDQVVHSFATAMRTLRPARALAFAGPVTFADRVNAHLNAHPEARDWRRMVKELQTEGTVEWPAPGSVLTLAGPNATRWEALNDWEALLNGHAQPPPDPEDPWLDPRTATDVPYAVSLEAFLHARSDLLRRLGERLRRTLVLSAVASVDALEEEAFLWHDQLSLNPPKPRWRRLASTERPRAPFLQIIATPRILHAFVRGETDLDGLLLSGRARFARKPDTFDGTLHNLLRFGDDAGTAQALIDWTAARQRVQGQATLRRTVDGRECVILRHCPHEGEDLENAPISADGRLTCPRHKWVFCVESGRCLSGDPSASLLPNPSSNAR